MLAWRILGSWSALLDTVYGQLLLVKIGFALVAIAIAGWNRWSLLPRLRRATKRDEKRAGARGVVGATAVEAIVLVAALIITGLLVDKSPEAEATIEGASSDPEPGIRTVTLGEIEVRAALTPLIRGPNTITVHLRSPAGEPTEGVAPPVLRLSSDTLQLGTVALTPVVAGTYTVEVVFPAPGTWRMQISLRVSEFANPVTILEFEVATSPGRPPPVELVDTPHERAGIGTATRRREARAPATVGPRGAG